MKLNNIESINTFLKHVDKYKLIAHRLGFLMEGYPENSLDNLVSIFNNQNTLNCINGIELDVQFTSDHIPVIIHDSSTADISEIARKIGKTNYNEVKNIKCGYRRSDYNINTPWNKNSNYNLQTLSNLLDFLMDNRSKLGDKIIKIETKSTILKKEDIITLKKLLIKYKTLNDNMVHISFFPWNLYRLRELEKKESLKMVKTELLADFNFERPLTKIWSSSIDGISLGIKNAEIKGSIELNKEAKNTANLSSFFYTKRNAISEEWLREIIKTYGYAGIYTINNIEDIAELSKRVSTEFLDEYANKLTITSDNPKYLRKLK